MSAGDFRDLEPEPLLAVPPAAPTAPSPLAVHGDPSRPAPDPDVALTQATDRAQRAQVAWMRPADMPTLVGRELLGRAVEVQATFAHRSWSAPARITRAAIATHDRPQAPESDAGPEPPRGVDARGVDADELLDGPDQQGVQLT